ncbi:MAG TPA: hypothetical protein VGO50_20845 [Pyrinomonadaceae bacterium]|jgi:hypothetical protein|nr:hypothetical protein [Pyrinomonadaceae bacterium]
MLGIIIVLVLLYQVYKAAKESGRSGVLWALGTFVGSIVFQIGVGLALGVVLLLVGGIDMVDKLSWPVGIVTWIINVVVIWQIIKYLNKVPDETYSPTPPSPPTFS